MSSSDRMVAALITTAWLAVVGCAPTQPFYLHEDGDLSHYLEVASDLEYPDVDHVNDFQEKAEHAPLSLTNMEFQSFWDITLEEAVAISLHNSQVIRSIGAVRQSTTAGQSITGPPDALTANPDFSATILDPAIQQTSTNGVEAALAAFDAQFSTRSFWEKTDRQLNSGNILAPTQRDLWNFDAEITKRSAQGTQWFLRNVTTYDNNNQEIRQLPRDWFTAFEAEARHPFMRNGGTQINRIPVMLARIREDISLAEFEARVADHVAQVERAYWDLYFFYRTLKATKSARDSAFRTWQRIGALSTQGIVGAEADREAQARAQYFQFQARAMEQLRDLLQAENVLRWLIGIDDTDGRILRPADEPTRARVTFDWGNILCEAMVRRPGLRRQKWRIKEAEMQLIAAKNQLLPQVDGVFLYRFLGLGHGLIENRRVGLNFPDEGSMAFDELTEGRYQEYRLGFEVNTPIGYRAELAQVRNSQLTHQRARMRLDELEREVRSQLNAAWRDVDTRYRVATTNFNRFEAAAAAVDAIEVSYRLGRSPLDLLLSAQQEQADAEIAFYQALVEHSLAIMEIHRRKGSLLDFNAIALSEGPWPKKAYFDALDRARQRDASPIVNYGYSRPRVISRGPLDQHENGGPLRRSVRGSVDGMPVPDSILGEPLDTPAPTGPAGQPTPAGPLEILPEPAVEDAANAFSWGNLGIPRTASTPVASPTPASAVRQASAVQRESATPAAKPGGTARGSQAFEWGEIGL